MKKFELFLRQSAWRSDDTPHYVFAEDKISAIRTLRKRGHRMKDIHVEEIPDSITSVGELADYYASLRDKNGICTRLAHVMKNACYGVDDSYSSFKGHRAYRISLNEFCNELNKKSFLKLRMGGESWMELS